MRCIRTSNGASSMKYLYLADVKEAAPRSLGLDKSVLAFRLVKHDTAGHAALAHGKSNATGDLRRVTSRLVTATLTVAVDGQTVTVRAIAGWQPTDWELAVAAAGLGDDYVDFDYELLDDGSETWTLHYLPRP